MRVLGIETSSIRGSVALVENDQVLCERAHDRINAHGESIQPLINEVLAEAGWDRRSLDKIAVGTGPGSFTGLRVGIALALGMGEGLGIPVVGVCSLRSMAAAAPTDSHSLRCAILDARRQEVFVGVYDQDLHEVRAPFAHAQETVLETLQSQLPQSFLLLGLGCKLLPSVESIHRSQNSDLPSAAYTAKLGQLLGFDSPPTPCYVRNSVAVKPTLPPNPLNS